MAIPFLACMALVASVYHLPPRVLPAIQAVEGGEVGSVSRNVDGSDDLGVMQVNTLWLEPLARVSGLPPAEVRRRLVFAPCFNIAAAGLIMRAYLNETHDDLLRAVGDYHSHTPMLNERYQEQVLAAARRLFKRAAGAPSAPR
jgi:soluble lytic murein transglycosylase-like protein